MAKLIPDRWIPYKPYGRVIDGTRIICFKVPLHKRIQKGNKEIKEIWDVKTLLKKIPNLGAVIDLTNTTRYYDTKELKDAGVMHKKIFMPGRVIPPEDKVQEFMNAVDEFLGKDCESLVGVHCTHGLNRTGYMVCRYMRDRLQIPASSAIKKFEKARGYQIERENYIADLRGEKPPPPYFGDEYTGDNRDSDPGKKSVGSGNKRARTEVNSSVGGGSKRARTEVNSSVGGRSKRARTEVNSSVGGGSKRARTEVNSWRDECTNNSYENARTYRKYSGRKEKRYESEYKQRWSDSDRSMDYTFDY